MKKKYFLIMNPGSRGGHSKKHFKKILKLLERYKINYTYKITDQLNDAYNFSYEANKSKNYHIIIAVGGDGTINQVINGFYDKKGKRLSTAKLGVIYTGTSPDFCKSYQVPLKLKTALKCILEGRSKKITTGKIIHYKKWNPRLQNKKINLKDKDLETKIFACCTNIGLGAALARRANSGIRKHTGDFLGTFISLIITLFKYKPSDFIYYADRNLHKTSKLFNLSVGRTFYIASGIKVKNRLADNKKNFYILKINKLNLFKLFKVIYYIYSGRQIKNKKYIELLYCDKIKILGNNENPEIEMDGDPAGFLPCKIEKAEDPLEIICQAEK